MASAYVNISLAQGYYAMKCDAIWIQIKTSRVCRTTYRISSFYCTPGTYHGNGVKFYINNITMNIHEACVLTRQRICRYDPADTASSTQDTSPHRHVDKQRHNIIMLLIGKQAHFTRKLQYVHRTVATHTVCKRDFKIVLNNYIESSHLYRKKWGKENIKHDCNAERTVDWYKKACLCKSLHDQFWA